MNYIIAGIAIVFCVAGGLFILLFNEIAITKYYHNIYNSLMKNDFEFTIEFYRNFFKKTTINIFIHQTYTIKYIVSGTTTFLLFYKNDKLISNSDLFDFEDKIKKLLSKKFKHINYICKLEKL